MSIIPQLDLDTSIKQETKVKENQALGITFLFDFKAGDFILKDGRLVKVEDLEALKVWIEKILRTEKFKFKIYHKEDENTNQYGVTIRNLILGQKYPLNFIKSELRREIKEALVKHPLILSIEGFKTNQQGTTLNIFFTVILSDGRTFDQEVSLNG